MKKISLLNPYGLFAVGAVAFVGWVIYDASQTSGPHALEIISNETTPQPVHGLAAIKGLEMLRPGTFRPEVEERLKLVLGMVPADVGAVDLAAGFPSYSVRYRFSPGQAFAQKPVMVPHSITVTYDARSVGHPLVCISVVPDNNGGIKRSTAV